MLINVWHNYSRNKNVKVVESKDLTSSMLAFSDDATTQKRVFKVDFFLLFDVKARGGVNVIFSVFTYVTELLKTNK